MTAASNDTTPVRNFASCGTEPPGSSCAGCRGLTPSVPRVSVNSVMDCASPAPQAGDADEQIEKSRPGQAYAAKPPAQALPTATPLACGASTLQALSRPGQ